MLLNQAMCLPSIRIVHHRASVLESDVYTYTRRRGHTVTFAVSAWCQRLIYATHKSVFQLPQLRIKILANIDYKSV